MKSVLAVMAALALMLSACVVSPAYEPGVAIGVSPGPDYIWVGGDYGWYGGRYTHGRGHWGHR